MERKKCEAYCEKQSNIFDYPTMQWRTTVTSICLGTPDGRSCACGGYEANCTFYPAKKFKALQYIAQIEYRQQYEKGYKDGYDAAMKAVWDLVEKHLDRSV